MKKYRIIEGSFLVEGDKIVQEVINSEIHIKELFATRGFLNENALPARKKIHITEANPDELKKASLLKQPQNCIAICEIPTLTGHDEIPPGFSFYLDGIQDPGNLGTIIRTCDWFGVKNLFCSPDTVDVYNPKVIQATMGSFIRVKIMYTPLEELIARMYRFNIPVYGTFLDGKNIFTENLPGKALVVLGNEGRGIREEAADKITHRLTIPSFSQSENRPESLNVAVTAAIVCNEFARKKFSTRNENSA